MDTYSLSTEDLRKNWEQGTSLFEEHDYEESSKVFRRTLRNLRASSTLQALIWANIGINHAHLGEYYSASQHFQRAARLDPGNGIYWLILSLSNFQLKEYHKAKRYMEACLACFPKQVERVDCITLGLNYVLEKSKIEENLEQLTQFVDREANGMNPQPSTGLHRLPAGRIFQTPVLH